MPPTKPRFAAAVASLLCATAAAAQTSAPTASPSPEVYRRLADDIEFNLQNQILDKWFPAAFDERGGGFFQNFNEDWSRGPIDFKGVVYESRLTWTSAQAATRFPQRSAMYLAQTRHGLAFLADKMWDAHDGGFFWSVDDAGQPAPRDGSLKQGYGNAFAIYSAAASYEVTHDPAALDLAKKGFVWYDDHAHDAKNGGYFETAAAAGPQLDAPNPVGAFPGGKSMNTSIHLLEALTGLYAVWPDPVVHARLHEMFEIVRDRVYADPGYLHMFFTAAWRPIGSRDSYGHDVETAYLLTEAAAALGIPDDARAWTAARNLVDHALQVGVDSVHGGLYNEGAISSGDYTPLKDWWVQAEGLNAFLLMHERYGRETPRYWDAFLTQWDFIQRHQIDLIHGGWYPEVRPDGTPVPGPKSDEWTECYHQGRAMLNVSAMLRKMAAR
jgi:cellobiose epimerase